MVAYLLVRRLRTQWARAAAVIVAIVWALAMGLSRVFLGHHWLTDVIFAWLLGAAWLALVITSHRLFLTIRRAEPSGGAVTLVNGSGKRADRRGSSRAVRGPSRAHQVNLRQARPQRTPEHALPSGRRARLPRRRVSLRC